MTEARTQRLLPGDGGLDIQALLDVLPADIPIGVEIPLTAQYPHMTPAERLAMIATATRSYLS